MLNLLNDIRDLSHQIPRQRKLVDEALAELHQMEIRLALLASQVSYERSRELLEERLKK